MTEMDFPTWIRFESHDWKPRPKYATDSQKQKGYYNDHDITTKEGLLSWHREMLRTVSRGGKGLSHRMDGIRLVSKEARSALQDAEQKAIYHAESGAPVQKAVG